MGKIIGIISLKGGVGKTNCTVNIGASLANQFGKKVLMVDANFSSPNLALHLGIADNNASVQDALNGNATLQSTIHPYQDNIHIIPSSPEAKEVRDHYKLRELLQPMKEYYDAILIDSSPNLYHEILSTMIASDELYVVASPDTPTLHSTMHAVKLAKQRNTPIKGLILNKVRNKKFELSIEEIEKATGAMVLGEIPDDINLLEAVSKSAPVVSYAPRSDSSIELNKIAAHIIGESYEDPRFWRRVKNFFRKDIHKTEVNKLLVCE